MASGLFLASVCVLLVRVLRPMSPNWALLICGWAGLIATLVGCLLMLFAVYTGQLRKGSRDGGETIDSG
jgi:hypothetical protein